MEFIEFYTLNNTCIKDTILVHFQAETERKSTKIYCFSDLNLNDLERAFKVNRIL